MISGWELYWITRLTEIKKVLVVLSIVGTVAWVGLFMCFVLDDLSKFTKQVKDRFKKGAFFLILIWCLIWLLPTTKEMFAIKVIPAIVRNEKVQELPQKALEYADKWLKSQLEELRK